MKIPNQTVGLSVVVLVITLVSTPALADDKPSQDVQAALDQPIESKDAVAVRLQEYLTRRIPKLSAPPTSGQWLSESQRLRRHLLQDIAFHGWPKEWVTANVRFTELGVMETGKGYRLHKLRYEIVPEYSSTAILYEPQKSPGRKPGILSLNGHEPAGNAVGYKQALNINLAKKGIFVLSLEWPGFGELALPENQHDYGAHLDLIGANALGFFYLAMSRGLDYLASLPEVDTARLGVTGLSGGGWQTIVLSALDDRVAAAAEVAGFGSLESNILHPRDTDEIEETPTDFTAGQDFTHLTAMRSPRPTLLIHNGEDDCCFRSAVVKPYIFDQIRPFFKLLGHEDALAWYENLDPGTHNYEIDNRQQAYKFFVKHFQLQVPTGELPVEEEIRAPQDLAIGVPDDNLTIAGLARKMAQGIRRPAVPSDRSSLQSWMNAERKRLEFVVRFKPVTVENAWRVWNTKRGKVESLSYRFDFSNGLSATGTWLKPINFVGKSALTIVLNDQGRKAAAEMVSSILNRGEQVLVFEPLFNGTTAPELPDSTDWGMLVSTTGDRPLGLQVAQLMALAHWAKARADRAPIRLQTTGIRTQVLALIAAAIEPSAFQDVASERGMRSLSYLLDTPVPLRSAPELFCLDLYKYFDIDRLIAMTAPMPVTTAGFVEDSRSPVRPK